MEPGLRGGRSIVPGGLSRSPLPAGADPSAGRVSPIWVRNRPAASTQIPAWLPPHPRRPEIVGLRLAGPGL